MFSRQVSAEVVIVTCSLPCCLHPWTQLLTLIILGKSDDLRQEPADLVILALSLATAPGCLLPPAVSPVYNTKSTDPGEGTDGE